MIFSRARDGVARLREAPMKLSLIAAANGVDGSRLRSAETSLNSCSRTADSPMPAYLAGHDPERVERMRAGWFGEAYAR